MPDAFDSATSTIDASRSALLAAIAKAGTAGRTAYEGAQADLAAQRQQAVSGALAAAAHRGAPGALQAELNQTIAQPYERGIASLRSGAASRAGDLAARQANSESYLGEVSAAMPVVKAQAERQLAALRAAAAEKAADRALSLERAQLGLEGDRLSLAAAQARAAAASGKAAGGIGGADSLSDSELNNRLMGAGEVQKLTTDAYLKTPGRKGWAAPSAAGTWAARTRAAAVPIETRARSAGLAAGIDPVRVLGVVPAPAAKAAATAKAKAPPVIDAYAKKAGLTDRHATDLRRNSNYGRAQKFLAAQATAGTLTREALAQLLSSKYLQGRDGIKRLLAAEAEEYF